MASSACARAASASSASPRRSPTARKAAAKRSRRRPRSSTSSSSSPSAEAQRVSRTGRRVPCRMARTGAAAPTRPEDNDLLAALPAAELAALRAELEPVELALGRALYESGGKQDYVYFPTDAVISLLYVLENGASTELAVTGHDGVVGISLFMGGETTPSRAVVQIGGRAHRLPARPPERALPRRAALVELPPPHPQA